LLHGEWADCNPFQSLDLAESRIKRRNLSEIRE
jgi:hypothetical protein